MNRIGFIGLGVMGAPMAANLLRKGYQVTIYNRTPGKADELVELGADVAGTPAAAARAAELVVTMISNDDAIREVYYGQNGLLSELLPGTIIIDSSTISPSLARQIAADTAAKSADFLDAPVTGSKPAAENGTLVFMVGGNAEAMEKSREVLLAMGRKIIYMGPSGSGATAKIAHNTVVGINAAALIEGMTIAAGGGIDAAAFLELVGSGGAASRFAEMKTPKLLERDFSVQFSLSLMLKDLRLSSALSDSLNVPTPVLESVKSVFQAGEAIGVGNLDLSALAYCYEQWIGKPITSHGHNETAAGLAIDSPAGNSPVGEPDDRRRSSRLKLHIPLVLSVYQWEQEGSFTGQPIDGVLCDLSDSGLQISSASPLERDMFVLIQFPKDSGLPTVMGRIIRIETIDGAFRYGCLLAGLAPYQRLLLEDYIYRQSSSE